jgi:hypothetical protein
MINFPNAPTVGQVFTSGSQSWIWDGTKWVANGIYVGPPQYSSDNRIINGDMRIDQRNGGAGVNDPNGYTVDRWAAFSSQTGKLQVGQSPTAPSGFGYTFWCSSKSAYTLLAADYFYFNQPIEADFITDFQWGAASAQPVTLSFWVAATQTGLYGGAIRNGVTPARSYPFTFNATNGVWTKVVITIPGDTTGTWSLIGNGIGLYVRFDLGTGATYRAPANAWINGDYIGANGAVSLVNTNGAALYLTGVKLEIGSVATPFNRQSLAKSSADCQRYFAIMNLAFNGYSATGFAIGQTITMPATMRAAPALTFSSMTYNNCSTISKTTGSSTNPGVGATVTATGGASFYGKMTADAEL